MKRCLAFVCAALGVLSTSVVRADDTQAGSDLQAGGLRPPDAVQSDASTTPTAQTEATLDRADKEDSGRGLEFVWLNAEVGPEYLGLEALRDKQLVDGSAIKSKGAGMAYGAGIGVRLLVFTFGARFRLGNFSDYQLWTLNAEAGMHFPLGRLEPYFTLGGGYASLGDYKGLGGVLTPNNAHGFDARTSAGLDYYLTNTFSIGANLTGEVLFLSRAASAALPVSSSGQPEAAAYGQHGSGIGLGGTLSAVLGLHF
jgi:hypothetical protein